MWSLVVIACNEADRIEGCLASAADAAGRWVIDGGSTDATVARAHRAGAQVVSRRWTGYCDQRNFGLSLVQTPWVLFLDADEQLAPGADRQLTQWLGALSAAGASHLDGARVARRNAWLGRDLGWGRFGADAPTRVLRVGAGRWVGPEPHETLRVVGAVGAAPVRVLHEPYRDLGEHIEHARRYADQAAGRGARPGGAVARASLRFIDAYLLRSGCRDGWPGLAVAAIGAAAVWRRERRARGLA